MFRPGCFQHCIQNYTYMWWDLCSRINIILIIARHRHSSDGHLISCIRITGIPVLDCRVPELSAFRQDMSWEWLLEMKYGAKRCLVGSWECLARIMVLSDGWLLAKGSDHKMVASGNDASKCRIAPPPRKKLVRHRHFYRQSTASVRHRHSGIRVSPVPLLVTDLPGIVKPWLFCINAMRWWKSNTVVFTAIFCVLKYQVVWRLGAGVNIGHYHCGRVQCTIFLYIHSKRCSYR